MRRLPPLPALRSFEAAARHGSFKHAADELAVTATAISHQIRALEEYLGIALFERQVRKVVLTEAGAALYPVLRDGFDSFAAALQQLVPAPARRHVTITATGAFMSRWLAPRVARFRALHPDIDLELRATDAVVDLHAAGADLAVRYGRGPYPGLLAEPLFGDRFAPVASPALGAIVPADLATLPLIEFSWRRPHPDNPTWKTWFAAAGLSWRAPRGRLRFSDEDHAIQAALAGQGVALLGIALLGDELAAGRLRQPFGPTVPGHTYHLVRSAATPATPEMEAALAWLRSEAKIS